MGGCGGNRLNTPVQSAVREAVSFGFAAVRLESFSKITYERPLAGRARCPQRAAARWDCEPCIPEMIFENNSKPELPSFYRPRVFNGCWSVPGLVATNQNIVCQRCASFRATKPAACRALPHPGGVSEGSRRSSGAQTSGSRRRNPAPWRGARSCGARRLDSLCDPSRVARHFSRSTGGVFVTSGYRLSALQAERMRFAPSKYCAAPVYLLRVAGD